MRIDAYFAPSGVADGDVDGRVAVVIDVIRATTCITEAMANGARTIFPTASIEEATKLGASLDREQTLLCGERKGVAISGFDLGNSPAEFTPERVAGKQLVMTTTNGTRAFLAAEDADLVLSACFQNLSAVVEAVGTERDLAVVCAGKEDQFALDDVVCAGHLIRRVMARLAEPPELNDAAGAAATLAERFEPTADFLARTAAGQALVRIGLESDLPLCAAVDKHTIVPRMYDRRISTPGE
ncbi:MAG: 2-phosphosulfolactate phosphatase [Gemmatimonadota bacterium]|nr:2-phosphosulfolactate phosphatase [Gemmatimonadota bacterium]